MRSFSRCQRQIVVANLLALLCHAVSTRSRIEMGILPARLVRSFTSSRKLLQIFIAQSRVQHLVVRGV